VLTLAPGLDAGTATRTVALAGNPNSGKTTVFNALTGLRQKVANYPGVTVDKKIGRCRGGDGRWIDVIDLPGTYSLIPNSPDEQVTAEVLVAVVDASNLPRSLYLISQLLELRKPLAIALNMSDIAERRGLRIDVDALTRELGVPVVPMVGHRRRGVQTLREAISALCAAPIPAFPMGWDFPPALSREIRGLTTAIGPATASAGCESHRLLIDDPSSDIAALAQRLQAPLAEAHARLSAEGIDAMQADIEARYRWIDGIVSRCVAVLPQAPARTLTERVDSLLMHPVSGMLAFALVMGLVFVSVFWVAQPLMDGITDLIARLGAAATAHLADGPLKSLIVDGVFAGVGAVVVFIPQIAILFLFLAILEDSGYLARAAFLMDRVFAKVGLHGKSFIPLLSSFACAIPGIMAARTIDSRKDRLATIMVAPFMSCSARLPVYFLLIGTFFAPFFSPGMRPFAQGAIMLGCYVLGIAAAAIVAWIFRRTLLRKGPPSTFILEMPSYKIPQPIEIGRQVWTNASKFLTKAGTVIFSLSVLLWALAYYPRLPDAQRDRIAAEALAGYHANEALSSREKEDERTHLADNAVGSAQIAHSCAGRFGHAIEPALEPIGCDWKMGIGLVGAFAAREVFVSTLGIVYGVGDPGDEVAGLSAAITGDRHADGSPVWTPLVAATLLVWFVLAMQCMSTIAVVRRETGGWRWPIFMLVYMNALAYVVCLGFYQVGVRVIG
jgi:ferrous iron transport protein B